MATGNLIGDIYSPQYVVKGILPADKAILAVHIDGDINEAGISTAPEDPADPSYPGGNFDPLGTAPIPVLSSLSATDDTVTTEESNILTVKHGDVLKAAKIYDYDSICIYGSAATENTNYSMYWVKCTMPEKQDSYNLVIATSGLDANSKLLSKVAETLPTYLHEIE